MLSVVNSYMCLGSSIMGFKLLHVFKRVSELSVMNIDFKTKC